MVKTMRSPVLYRICLTLSAGMLAGGIAQALINPNFTPLNLVAQSGIIATVSFDTPAAGKRHTATVTRFIKGKLDSKKVTFDLSFTPFEAKADAVAKMFAEKDGRPIVLLIGAYETEDAGGGMDVNFGGGGDMGAGEGGGEGEGDDAGPRKAYLLLGTKWVRFFEGDNEVWEMDDIDTHMLATWHGSPDMFVRCVEYVLRDAEAYVPVRTEAEWERIAHVGKAPGKLTGMASVDLKGDGHKSVFVGSTEGDRLLTWDAAKEALVDVTAKVKLASKSAQSAWGDFNRDGRVDLVSWSDGKLLLGTQAQDGSLVTAPLNLKGAIGEVCLGLAAVGMGGKQGNAILFSRTGSPILLVPAGDGFEARPLPAGAEGKCLPSEAGACLVADFDGDHMADVLQPFVKASLFYKATAPGVFAAPRELAMAMTHPRAYTSLGDYDADGRFDLLCTPPTFSMLWSNEQGMKFTDRFDESGEPSYISQAGPVKCGVADINNDGRQDFWLIYGAGTMQRPQFFFSRGFRSFGHSHMLDFKEAATLAESDVGQQDALVEDVDGDGAQDLVIALVDGNIWLVLRKTQQALALRVALAPGSSSGPVRVTGHLESRDLGAWNVVAGGSDAFFGRFDPGPLTIRWQIPGGKPQEKEFILEDKTVRFVIPE